MTTHTAPAAPAPIRAPAKLAAILERLQEVYGHLATVNSHNSHVTDRHLYGAIVALTNAIKELHQAVGIHTGVDDPDRAEREFREAVRAAVADAVKDGALKEGGA